MNFLTAACGVSLLLALWAFMDYFISVVAGTLPNFEEVPCAQRRAPARITVVGPPNTDVALKNLDACGSAVTEIELTSTDVPIRVAWDALETSPDVVVIHDMGRQGLNFAHAVQSSGFIGVVLMYAPDIPYIKQVEMADDHADIIDGVAADSESILALYEWAVSRHKQLPQEFLSNYSKLIDNVTWHFERGDSINATRLAYRAVWRASMRGEMRLYSCAKRLVSEIGSENTTMRIKALRRVTDQAYSFRSNPQWETR